LLFRYVGSQVALSTDAGVGVLPTLLGALALGALASAVAARRITGITPASALRSS
jgi:ABC-type lipoprotein release transport system permease subunit